MGKGRGKEKDVRCLAAEHFNQGVSNAAWPTLSSIIDVCRYSADESLSHSSDLGILSPTQPMTPIYINHGQVLFTQSNINTSTCKATWCREYRWSCLTPRKVLLIIPSWRIFQKTNKKKLTPHSLPFPLLLCTSSSCYNDASLWNEMHIHKTTQPFLKG